MKSHAFGVALAAALVATPAAAVTINFDDVPAPTVITNQYAGAVFSSEAGFNVLTLAVAATYDTTVPNIICSGLATTVNCFSDVYVDFTSAVNGLSFYTVGDNSAGDLADVRVFSGATLLGTVDVVGDADPFNTTIVIDLAGFADVTRIEIVDIADPLGLGFDDFTFESGPTGGGVPEPGVWALMLLGFGGAGAALRAQRRRLALA